MLSFVRQEWTWCSVRWWSYKTCDSHFRPRMSNVGHTFCQTWPWYILTCRSHFFCIFQLPWQPNARLLISSRRAGSSRLLGHTWRNPWHVFAIELYIEFCFCCCVVVVCKSCAFTSLVWMEWLLFILVFFSCRCCCFCCRCWCWWCFNIEKLLNCKLWIHFKHVTLGACYFFVFVVIILRYSFYFLFIIMMNSL